MTLDTPYLKPLRKQNKSYIRSLIAASVFFFFFFGLQNLSRTA